MPHTWPFCILTQRLSKLSEVRGKTYPSFSPHFRRQPRPGADREITLFSFFKTIVPAPLNILNSLRPKDIYPFRMGKEEEGALKAPKKLDDYVQMGW